MLLSYAGRGLAWCDTQIKTNTNTNDKTLIVDQVGRAFKEVHRLGVQHGDAEARNVLYHYDTERGSPMVMVVDFETARFCTKRQKRKRGEETQQKEQKKQKKKGDSDGNDDHDHDYDRIEWETKQVVQIVERLIK
ncbi:hypothetical protein QBC46DRAFT_379626 [Diplogelasinospora grovesii]|uniref:Protein kinase domain-containing protein n=1 Tax=Diplogelasinospora grovesii TaxID=303347 RepID=A0AAN6NCS3_9PEZI|nr:hypothetical protein QBC46DRAFT_379626 [Diplogelasinospora grovesii]